MTIMHNATRLLTTMTAIRPPFNVIDDESTAICVVVVVDSSMSDIDVDSNIDDGEEATGVILAFDDKGNVSEGTLVCCEFCGEITDVVVVSLTLIAVVAAFDVVGPCRGSDVKDITIVVVEAVVVAGVVELVVVVVVIVVVVVVGGGATIVDRTIK